MKEYLNEGIKGIITRFPEIERILSEYDIGCAPCSVGSCQLKDIIEIHSLSTDDERELVARMAAVIYPGQEVEIPCIERKPRAGSRGITYSPPMKKLVNEHLLIKRLVALIPQVIDNLDVESESGRQVIIDAVDFIRSYADRFHHAKEEGILFQQFDEDLDILKVIREDHETGRSHVRAVLEALDGGDRQAIREHLTAYQELLTEHIRKEDEILYPWMDRVLSISQIGELFSRFNEKEEELGDAPKRYEDFINRLERGFAVREAAK